MCVLYRHASERELGGGGEEQGVGFGRGGGVAGHMAGRWLLRRPLDLALVQHVFLTKEPEHGHSRTIKNNKGTAIVETRAGEAAVRAVEQYIAYVERNLSDSFYDRRNIPVMDLCLPLYLIVEQLREDYDAVICGDSTMMTKEEMEVIHDAIRDCLVRMSDVNGGGNIWKKNASNDVNFKRLSTSFKGLVGKKVLSKWKRNRAEMG